MSATNQKPTHKPYSMRLPPEIRELLQSQAAAKGLSESEYGRMLLIEKLQDSTTNPAALIAEIRSIAAVVIAALSETIELTEARELIAEHTAPVAANPSVTP
jgi:hypothetical protein